MPSGSRIVKALAEQGLDFPLLDARLRELRAAGLAPIGPKTQGRSILHWPARPYVSLLVSIHASSHTTVVQTVRALEALPHAASFAGDDSPFGGPRERIPPQNMTFGEYLAGEIQRASEMDATALAAKRAETEHATITMQLDPPRAEVRRPYGNGKAFTLVFEDPPPPRQPGWNALYDPRYIPKSGLWVRSTTVIPFALVLACAELLATNPTSSMTTGSPSDGGNLTPSTPNENAPDPGRSEAPFARGRGRQKRTKPQPPEASQTLEIREGGKSHQALCGPRHCLPRAQSSEELRHEAHQAA